MKTKVEQPNKRNIEALFRSMMDYQFFENVLPEHDNYERLRQAADKLQDDFDMSLPRVRAQRLKDEAYEEFRVRKDELSKEIAKVRRLYYAKGLTPDVLKRIEKLVNEINDD